MTEEQYNNMLHWIRQHDTLAAWLPVIMRTITHATAIGYACLLFILFQNGDTQGLYESILIPAVSFAAVSLFRYFAKAKRPYERYDIEPLVEKESTGNSFPSRHVFSIMIIAGTFFQQSVGLGIFFFVLGIILAILRVITGLHFIKDVVAGAAIALLVSLCYFII